MKEKLLKKQAELAAKLDELYDTLFDNEATERMVEEIAETQVKLDFLEELLNDN